jgi:hypothetical protein
MATAHRHHEDEDPQQAVARARADVMGGRGPGAPKAETDRYKRERPTLGPLPAPLERELVHLDAMRMRSGLQQHVDPVSIRNQDDRLREVWATKPPGHPRSRAVRDAVGADATGGAGRSARTARWARTAVLAAVAAGALRRLRAGSRPSR